MNFVVQAIGALATLILPALTQIAARWGYKVALVAAVVAMYTGCWVAILALLAAAKTMLPATPFTAVALQFFPSASTVTSGASLYLGTLATLKWWQYFRLAFGVAAKVGS